MPTSTSRLSYSECFDYFEQANADPLGIALGFDHHGDARQFRLRMNAARMLDREENLKEYADQPEHPLYGRSVYDRFQLKIRLGSNGKTYVVIAPGVGPTEVISLSEIQEQLRPLPAPEWKAPTEVLKLTDRRF